MLQALLFDMNGVIVDDMLFHERAWISLAERHGRTLTSDEFRQQMSGRRNRDNIRHVFGDGLSDEQVRALQIEKEEAYRAAYRPHLAPLAGLRDLLAAARAADLRLAVVTSAPAANIDLVLDGLDLRSAFDCVVTEAEVRRSKPDPEIFLLAAERCGGAPADCVVFEDSLAGVAAAVAARMAVVGVSTTHTADELRGCARVVPDFRGVTVEQLRMLA
jgi:beta-phosphoglucomutase family hydrolase